MADKIKTKKKVFKSSGWRSF